MTRQQIIDDYAVRNGLCTAPGRFEGEPIYVPYFWDALMDGCADDDDGESASFIVDGADAAIFPELAADGYAVGSTVRIYQRSDGFVCLA